MKERVLPNPGAVVEDMLAKYPPKVAKKRARAIVVNDPSTPPVIEANVRSVPGIMTMRGCCYAGCKGVVIGPTRDILIITHGPIGCGYYSWLTRRNQTRPPTQEDANYVNYCVSTDMQEQEIVFGGEKKLKQAIEEAADIFKPSAIAIMSTCPVGLIGDDVHAVSREMSEKLGINVFGFSCEGYKGVSQSGGHHIANNQLFRFVIGRNDSEPEPTSAFRVNLLGEYNIGGDAFVIEELFERCGIELVSTFSGNSDYESMCRSHHADLNLVMCHRSINYTAEMMETKFGIPWMKINFIGAESTAKSLRRIAAYFEDDRLTERVERVIAEEMVAVEEAREEARSRCHGKTAMLYVGGSRSHHYQDLFREIGMSVVSAGYEFAHRDDYEGRRVLPDIAIDADSRNIEELKVDPDEARYAPRRTEEERAALAAHGAPLANYEGMMPDTPAGSLVVDDLNHHEMMVLLERYQPDIFCAGIKEKYVVEKLGIPCKQLHSYDYGGPFAGFQGAANFYRDIDRMLSSEVWRLARPPWEEPDSTETDNDAEAAGDRHAS
jgi:nitrogenase molybdenum-iron protein alpha chain